MKRVRQTAAIAGATARELMRNPAYAILVGAGVAAVALSPAFAMFHLGEQAKLVADLGLGTALVVGLLVGVLGASWAVHEEIENLTALAVLAKPVTRTGFLLGKYAGVVAAALAAEAALALALLFTMRAVGPNEGDAEVFLLVLPAAAAAALGGGLVLARLGFGARRAALLSTGLAAAALLAAMSSRGTVALAGTPMAGWAWDLAPGLVGVALQVAVLAAIAVALSTRLTLASNLPVVMGVLVLGQLAGQMRDEGGLAGRAAYLLPDLGVMQFSDAAAARAGSVEGLGGPAVPAGVMLAAAAVALAYAAGALALGAVLFGGRDVR